MGSPLVGCPRASHFRSNEGRSFADYLSSSSILKINTGRGIPLSIDMFGFPARVSFRFTVHRFRHRADLASATFRPRWTSNPKSIIEPAQAQAAPHN
jgi:hypothetical protein